MEKILIPTDFSLTAEKAYKMGAEIAKKTNSEILLLHIIPSVNKRTLSITGVVEPIVFPMDEEVKVAQSILEKLPFNDIFNGVNVTTYLLDKATSDIPTEISKFEKENKIDLVICGTDGSRTTRKNYAPIIVRQSECPVITIENEPVDFTFKNMVLATDFENVNYKMMESVWQLQQLFESKLTILFVNTPKQFKDTQKIENEYYLFINKFELENTELAIFNDYILEDGILKFAERVEADLLLMSTHGRTGLAHMFNKSHAEYVVGHAEMPVYIYNIHMDEVYFNYTFGSSAMSGGFA